MNRVLFIWFVVLASTFCIVPSCGNDPDVVTPGEIGDTCDSESVCQDHLVCEEGICVDPSNTGTDGACGPNSTTFTIEENEWPTEKFCTSGIMDVTAVAFPSPDEEVSWWCLGINGGDDVLCTASRSSLPDPEIDGACGANAQSFYRETVAWPGDEFCSKGMLQGATPDFPVLGGESNWICLGENGGQDIPCSADRLEVCSPERQAPGGWTRKTTHCAYSTSSGWKPDCLAWTDIWSGLFTQVSGVTYRLMVDSQVDEYIALEIDTNGMTRTATGRLNSAAPGDSIGHYRQRIATISRCPGDFHQTAVEAENGCYYNLTGISPNISWGGPDTTQSCKLDPDEVYFLNIIHTNSPAGTHPNALESNCDTDRCGAVYAPYQD